MIAMRSTRVHRLLVGPLAFVLAFAFASPVRADAADDLFDKGNAAYDGGKYEEAIVHFMAAWKLRKTHDLAATMAQAETKLGKHAEAAEHLAFALAHFPLTGKLEVKKRMEEALADAKKNVATVRVQTTAKDAAITIDGSPVDHATAGGELFLPPGRRVIEVSAPGRRSVRRTIDAKAGEEQALTFALPPAEQTAGRSMFLPAIAFSVSGAGLVLGAITAGVAAGKTSDLKKVCGEALACPPSERGALDLATTTADLSTAGFVLAAVGAAAGVTLLVVPIGEKPKAEASVAVGPAFISVKGAF